MERIRRAPATTELCTLPCLSNTEFSLSKGVHCMREEFPAFAISTMVSEQMPMSFGDQHGGKGISAGQLYNRKWDWDLSHFKHTAHLFTSYDIHMIHRKLQHFSRICIGNLSYPLGNTMSAPLHDQGASQHSYSYLPHRQNSTWENCFEGPSWKS